MNSQRPGAAGPGRKIFLGGVFFLLQVTCCLHSALASDGLAGSSASYPTIYVAKARPEVTNGLGIWMWDKATSNKQTVRLWKGFEIPATNQVVRAELRIAADNAYTISLDGQELGSGSDWRTLSIYYLEGPLKSGLHALAVEGFNDNDQAGIIMGMRLEMAGGQTMEIRSDLSWRSVPDGYHDWETALIAPDSWPHAAVARNFGRVPWWDVPISVLHIRGKMPGPVPVWQRRDFQIGLFTGGAVLVTACLCLLIQLLTQSKAHRLVQAERDRIARDIHDDLGSKLTQLLLIGEVAQMEAAPAADAPISRMCDGARSILSTIDDVVWIVNSQKETLEDFVIYVCKYAQRFLESSSIRCRFDAPHELPPKTLGQFARRNIFLTVKEALNNATKHSEATELTLHIRLEGSLLTVAVADNGRGFDAASVSPERNGLTNMRLRMAEIGGKCEVLSRPNEGCEVRFQVPLKQPSGLRSIFRLHPLKDFATGVAERREYVAQQGGAWTASGRRGE
ncbi:MAG TPA: ATP-binding protein [Verrucomicrobiae bacterium]|nr:ATP-binding protein [Verrucomicrobiae bacterium]